MKRKPIPTEPRVHTAASSTPSMRIGHLIKGATPSVLLVAFGGTSTPIAARTTVPLDEAAIARALATNQGVVLLFENDDPGLPVIVGLVGATAGSALLGDLLSRPVAGPAATSQPTEARVDGKRVVLEGHDEVVLKCGEASITLKRDGKIIIRGAYIETHAKGVNRIKGGSVKIN